MTIEQAAVRWPDTDEGRQRMMLEYLKMLIREQNETNRLLRVVVDEIIAVRRRGE
jgi:hypothetical protein